MLNKFLLGISVFIVFCSCQKKNFILAYDDFESNDISSIWKKDKFVEGAFTIQEQASKNGIRVGKFILKSGNQIEEERGTIYERAELKEAKKLFSTDHETIEYSFSIFLPSDFPKIKTRLVIAQWKQNCVKENCDPDNPILALRYYDGQFYITKQSSHKRDTLYTHSTSFLNQWQHFQFIIKYSNKDDGKIFANLNGENIIKYNGQTAYVAKNGEYMMPNSFYFKLGLYRDKCIETMIMYIDNYKKGFNHKGMNSVLLKKIIL